MRLTYNSPLLRDVSCVFLLFVTPVLAESRKDFRYTVGNNATISVTNTNGNVTVRAGSGRQVAIAATIQSSKIEVDSRQTGNRVEVRTHNIQRASPQEARVDYEINVPADASVNIDSADGSIQVEGLRGDVSIDSESGKIELRNLSGPGVQVQTVNASVALAEVHQSRVQLTSTGGDIQLTSVDGPLVSARTTSGNIRYAGDFSGNGRYLFTNHSGEIHVTLPANASVDLNARSIKGSVENDFPFKKTDHPPFPLAEGRSFAGRANSGSSSVELRSFSGKIRVVKQ